MTNFAGKGTTKNAHEQESEKFYKKIIDFNLFVRISSHYGSLLMIVRMKICTKGKADFSYNFLSELEYVPH